MKKNNISHQVSKYLSRHLMSPGKETSGHVDRAFRMIVLRVLTILAASVLAVGAEDEIEDASHFVGLVMDSRSILGFPQDALQLNVIEERDIEEWMPIYRKSLQNSGCIEK